MSLPRIAYTHVEVPLTAEPRTALDELLDRPHVLSGSTEPAPPPPPWAIKPAASAWWVDSPPSEPSRRARRLCPICENPYCRAADDDDRIF